MYKSKSSNKSLLYATYFRYSKKCRAFVYPVKISFYSSSENPRSLNDIAARYARENGIKWHYLSVRNLYGYELSHRYSMSYQCLIK